MTVIKKDGRKQAFDPTKIALSSIGAARDVGVKLSDREGEMLSQDVTQAIARLRGNDGQTSSYEIRMLLGLALKQFGYGKVAESYLQDALTE